MLKGPELGARRAPANLLPWPESRPYRGARVPSRPPVFQVTLGLLDTTRPYRGARVPSRPPVFQVKLGLRPSIYSLTEVKDIFR